MNNYDALNQVLTDIQNIGLDKFIIVTGGIGDFLTIDYFFSYGSTKNIIFISKQSLKLKYLFNFYYPEKKFYALYFDFSLINKPGFDKTQELLVFFPKLKNIFVVNISEYFPLIRRSQNLKILNNRILTQIIKPSIKNTYKIPETYAIINPFTEDNRINCIKCNYLHRVSNKCDLTRNFVTNDYKNILNFLKEKKITGVIISIAPITIPHEFKDVNIINLSHIKPDIIDCIELVKQCKYFFGVDSVFSVIASKILKRDSIYIKCNNHNAYNNKHIYWFPNKNINVGSYINIKY